MANSKKDTKSKLKRIAPVVLVLIALAVAADYFFFQNRFRYAGTLEATKVDIFSQVASQITTVRVFEGDHVEQNQNLIELACPDIRVAAQLATINFNRNLRLFKAGSTPQDTLDTMRNRKDDADVRLGWCTINSPLHATVLNRYHEPGEWANVGTKLLTLANIRDIWAYIYVAQPDIWRLKPGMELEGRLPEKPDRAFKGRILKINSEAEFTPKNVQTRSERERLVFGVKVSFLGSNDDEILKPGMTIEIVLPRQ
jgi:HlyD family secretion protein